ncbi:MAG: hypothetical protein ACRDP6_29180 [Actinoallomurus sp.]
MSARLMASILIVAGGLAAVVGTFGTTSDVTVRMTAAMAYGFGLLVLAVSMLLLATGGRASRRASGGQ